MNFISTCFYLLRGADQPFEVPYTMRWYEIAALAAAAAAYITRRDQDPLETSLDKLRLKEIAHRDILIHQERLTRSGIFEALFLRQKNSLAYEYEEARYRRCLMRKEMLAWNEILQEFDPKRETLQTGPSQMSSKCRQWQRNLHPLKLPTEELSF